LTIGLATSLHTQQYGQKLIDSLISRIEKTKEDTNRVTLFNKISFQLASYSIKEGIAYGQRGLRLAEKLD
jgi:hypothetical protein